MTVQMKTLVIFPEKGKILVIVQEEEKNGMSQRRLASVIQTPPSCVYPQSESHVLGHYTSNIDR